MEAGYGRNVNFWSDQWLPRVNRLWDVACIELDEALLSDKVVQFVNSNRVLD